jgi:hypothetical protein
MVVGLLAILAISSGCKCFVERNGVKAMDEQRVEHNDSNGNSQ